MGDSSSHHPTQSRMRLRNAGVGEIVEVQGGHIVRSIGRKDRHSKVCTAKGPRDRRVRLAAHTAIQFYDVQDRLGYDRPSKAVDWLINKAKAAIDELAHLPPWHPTLCSDQPKQLDEPQQQQHQFVDRSDLVNDNPSDENAQSSSFVPPSLDSDAIADTIKSFFPTSGASSAEASSSAMQFSDLLSRNGNNSQDLRLSLQSFQDPILLHHHNHQSQSQSYSEAQALLSATPLGFESWAEHHHQQVAELSRLQRLPPWAGSGSGDSAGGAGYLQQLLGQNQFVSQRGPLQSSNTPSIRAWMDPSAIAIAADDHRRPAIVPIYPSSMAGIGCIAGFHIPTRIQGNEEHDSYSDKPSSASSESRH